MKKGAERNCDIKKKLLKELGDYKNRVTDFKSYGFYCGMVKAMAIVENSKHWGKK